MGAVFAFNYPNWIALFPEFAYPGGAIPVTDVQAAAYFNAATSIHRNDVCGPVCDAAQQATLLNYLTAHIAKLYAAPAGGTVSPLVGRVSQASEGSVNVTVEMPTNMPRSSAFFTQTSYGLFYWQMSDAYRRARYIPNDANPVNAGTGPWGIGYGNGSGWVG